MLCRCPGTPVHLLSPAEDGMASSSIGVCVRVADGAVSVPTLEPAALPERGNAKRERKRQMMLAEARGESHLFENTGCDRKNSSGAAD